MDKLFAMVKSPVAKKLGVAVVCGVAAFVGLGIAGDLLTVGIVKFGGAGAVAYLAWTRLSLAEIRKLIEQGEAVVDKVEGAIK